MIQKHTKDTPKRITIAQLNLPKFPPMPGSSEFHKAKVPSQVKRPRPTKVARTIITTSKMTISTPISPITLVKVFHPAEDLRV